MDKKQFLQSGLLEQYVLGLTDELENEIVESHLRTFPELRDEIAAMQRALEQYAAQHAIPPPKNLRGQVLSEIEQLESEKNAPAVRRKRTFSWSAAAFILLACLSSWLLWSWQQSHREIEHLNARYAALAENCERQRERAAARAALFEYLHLPSTQSILLSGTPLAPGHFALAYWNPERRAGWLDPTDLPALKPDEQYQVWADVHGEMISIGLIPPGSRAVLELDYLAEAESINVTVEPVGGSEHPNVSKLVVNGAVL